jgi:hypothetical protein
MESPNQSTGAKLSFVFILNDIEVEGEMPIEIAPRHWFRKAQDEEVELIKKRLALFTVASLHFYPPSYELVIKEVKENPNSTKYLSEPLEKQKWRYWVISFEGTNTELSDIASAASLLRNDLELGFTLFNLRDGTSGFGWHTPSLMSFFEDKRFPKPPIKMMSSEIKEISANYRLIKQIKPEHVYITRAFRKFNELKSLLRGSELVVITLFSIIEALIAHNPKSTEVGDSLGHQIKTKIPLLSKRFQRSLPYHQYFVDTPEATVWAKLYEYRSKLVHGEDSRIDGTLGLLKDRQTVVKFLSEAVKLLLLLSLREPVLLTDLKRC